MRQPSRPRCLVPRLTLLSDRSRWLMRYPRVTFLLLCALLAAATAYAEDATGRVVLKLHAADTGPPISRHIFGQFAEHLGRGIYEGVWVGPESSIPNTRGIRNDVVTALRALHVPNVRWPGGCFADEYHWRKGVGPASHRPATINSNWGGVIEPNTFGTHEFMDFLEQIGAEAYISVNVGSGSVQEAAEWLEYLTALQPDALASERAANGHPAPYKVAFVGIGNENWGCGGAMSPEQYLGQLKIYSHYVRSDDPAQLLRRIAVGSDGGASDYTDTIMKAWQSRVSSWDIDTVSLHYYTVGKWPPHYKATGFAEADYAAVLKETRRMEEVVRSQEVILDKYDPQKKIGLAVDEWGSWLAPTPGTHPGFLEQQNSQRDALVAALGVNIFVRHADRVRMANIAQMINVLQAMILTSGNKMILTPTYHVYRMYVPFQDATSVAVSFDPGTYQQGDIRLPRVDAIAARDRNGKLWVAVTNIDPLRPVSLELAIDTKGISTASGQTLAAPHVDSVNTFDAPNTVEPKAIAGKASRGKLTVTLAPASVTVVGLE
jgi:alpha-N-arabinofuranosidase